MRKHIEYYYKCYDKQNESNMDRIINEKFNEYGYNFDSNSKRIIDYDALLKKKNYDACAESKKK